MQCAHIRRRHPRTQIYSKALLVSQLCRVNLPHWSSSLIKANAPCNLNSPLSCRDSTKSEQVRTTYCSANPLHKRHTHISLFFPPYHLCLSVSVSPGALKGSLATVSTCSRCYIRLLHEKLWIIPVCTPAPRVIITCINIPQHMLEQSDAWLWCLPPDDL